MDTQMAFIKDDSNKENALVTESLDLANVELGKRKHDVKGHASAAQAAAEEG
jgi:hypothetical protein